MWRVVTELRSRLRLFIPLRMAFEGSRVLGSRGALMQQSTFKLSRLDPVLLAGELIDNGDAHVRVANPVSKLRGEIPLDLFPAQGANSLK